MIAMTVREGFCYSMHEARPAMDCIASWESLFQAGICIAVFFHLLNKLMKGLRRALAGHLRNTIHIKSHSQEFLTVVLMWVVKILYEQKHFQKVKLGDLKVILFHLIHFHC